MKRAGAASIVTVIAVLLGASTIPALAAPPTVTPSPGYDARLQEQRAAQTAAEPVAPVTKPAAPRNAKRKRAH